jgi:serine/threonine-protein kinase RsbW
LAGGLFVQSGVLVAGTLARFHAVGRYDPQGLLIFERDRAVGRVDSRRLSVPGTDEGIQTALDALAGLLGGQGLSKAVTWPVEVSLDEVLANVVRHGLEGREAATVEIELSLDAGVEPPACEVVVADDGPGFNPLSVPEPDTSLGIEERPIGGLGIALVRRLMDEVEYERRDGKNRLRLRRRLVAIEA